LAAPKTKLEQEVEQFLALSKEERQHIARDIVKKLVEAKRKKAAV
jgi:ribosomal protein L18E